MASETLSETVARLRKIARSGISSVTADGITTNFDQAAAARALREAQQEQSEAEGLANPRPTTAQIRLW